MRQTKSPKLSSKTLTFDLSKNHFMHIPEELKYTKDHEWVRIEGNIGTIGITDFAQHELGDIVYIDIESIGCLLYTSPSPRDRTRSRMPSSA